LLRAACNCQGKFCCKRRRSVGLYRCDAPVFFHTADAETAALQISDARLSFRVDVTISATFGERRNRGKVSYPVIFFGRLSHRNRTCSTCSTCDSASSARRRFIIARRFRVDDGGKETVQASTRRTCLESHQTPAQRLRKYTAP
jgi:hypothetical protein